MSNHIVKFHNLGRKFGYRWVIKQACGEINQQENLAIFGANGAGKSTLLALLCQVYRKDEGILEYALDKKVQDFQKKMLYLGHQAMLYPRLTAKQNLDFNRKIYSFRNPLESNFVLDFFGLKEFESEPIEIFSRGMLQRLVLAKMLMLRPQYLFLDEPFTGLDFKWQKVLTSILKDRGLIDIKWKFNSLVLVDHDIERAFDCVDRTWIVQDRKVYQDPVLGKIPLGKIKEYLSN